MTSRALITGATAGIGLEFARQLAARGAGLVLVARDGERLARVARELGDEHGVAVETLAADLHTDDGVRAVDARVAALEKPVDLLINNAGYGIGGDLAATDPDDEQKHLAIHVAVPLRLTQTALRRMLATGGGRIAIVSSVAAFTPRGTYGAAKAWGVSFARWANLSYEPRGVSVTAIAPGFVRTEFHERMGVDVSGIPEALWLDAPTVVRQSLRAIDRGRSVVIPTVRWRVIAALARILPDRLSAAGQFRSR
ncbi:MAG TPA: SDR family NAD(P)-dependent oxidoreductase [Microcella sp.]|nr:SDR family NAD(P)-dependent oxidoreductase [Microcella sp.]